MQCPICKYKGTAFRRVFRRAGKGRYACVKCSANVRFEIEYLKLLGFALLVALPVGVIGALLKLPTPAISGLSGGIGGGVTAAAVSSGVFLKVEAIPE